MPDFRGGKVAKALLSARRDMVKFNSIGADDGGSENRAVNMGSVRLGRVDIAKIRNKSNAERESRISR